MERLDFLVQGSADDPYRVSFVLSDGPLVITCTCEAGMNGMHCKHRIRIITGVTDGCLNPNAEMMAQASVWAAMSPVKTALDECLRLEAEMEGIKRNLKTAKKRLAAAMYGHA